MRDAMCLNKSGCAMVVMALIMSLEGVYINVNVKGVSSPMHVDKFVPSLTSVTDHVVKSDPCVNIGNTPSGAGNNACVIPKVDNTCD